MPDGFAAFMGFVLGCVVALVLIAALVLAPLTLAPDDFAVRSCEFAGHAAAVADAEGNIYCVRDMESLVLFEAAED